MRCFAAPDRARPMSGLVASLAPLLLLAACGGGGGSTPVASTPTPTPAPTPAPTPTPAPSTYDTAEYRRSNAAVQARALSAYTAGATGAGVLAGVIDSGVDTTSSEFAGKISGQSGDFAGTRGLQDEGGHGTAVASVLLAAKNDSGIHGVAFDATLLVLRADTPGSCTAPGAEVDNCSYSDNAIARGLDRATAARAKVVNISLGGSAANATLRAAIDRATAAGTIIVFSAGNDGVTDPAAAVNPDRLAQIANDPVARGLVLVAGSTDANLALADFSNRAGNTAAHYLTALGVRVRAPDQTGTSFLFSGTSLSAPVVAGAVALLAQAFPALTPTQIVDLLLRTATDLGGSGTDAVYGRGELNLERAFAPQGSLSLAAAPDVAVSATVNATLASAMGDAGQGGLGAHIRDGYGRGYAIDLAPTLRRAGQPARLTGALAGTARSLAVARGAGVFALTVADDHVARLRLVPGEALAARALAGSVAARLGPHSAVAFGFASDGAALARQLQQAGGPAFVATRDAPQGFERDGGGAVALLQVFGRLGITVAAEQGVVRRALAIDETRGLGGRHGYASAGLALDRRAGPLTATLRLTRLDEADTVLGGELGRALGGGGAATWFADAGLATGTGPWRLAATVRRGWTALVSRGGRAPATLATQAWSVEVERTQLFGPRDSLALRWSEPLRVVRGTLAVAGFDAPLDLRPQGHERGVEAVYALPIGAGSLILNGYWRHQPGNIAAAPTDVGTALRYALTF